MDGVFSPDGQSPDGGSPGTTNDRLNLNCTIPGGLDEGAEACSARLGMLIPGARFFLGPRRACDADIFSAACRELCPLSAMSPDNCGFAAPRGGCPFNASEGYAVVVDVGGRRELSAVGAGDTCGVVPSVRGQAIWGRVQLADLQTAAMSVRRPPADGGVRPDTGTDATQPDGPPTDVPAGPSPFVPCEGAGMRCGPTALELSCQTLRMGRFLCTRTCTRDEDCGSGACRSVCYARCEARPCAPGLTCSDGICQPM